MRGLGFALALVVEATLFWVAARVVLRVALPCWRCRGNGWLLDIWSKPQLRLKCTACRGRGFKLGAGR